MRHWHMDKMTVGHTFQTAKKSTKSTWFNLFEFGTSLTPENGHVEKAPRHAGLRGAIALVLCWELGDWVDEIEGSGTKEMLVTSDSSQNQW